MNWFYFLLGSLATFRLSLLLSSEDGPAWIFRKLRNVPSKKSSLHEGIKCLYCVSVYMAALVTFFFVWRGMIHWPDTPLFWLAFSASAIAINNGLTRDPS